MKSCITKKTFCVCLTCLLIIMLSIIVHAIPVNEVNIISTNENNISVKIVDTSNLTDDQIEKITNVVIAYHCNHESVDVSIPYGLTCTLFGHDEQQNMISVIDHKVRATNPRCLETKYIVTTCSRCEYENIEYVTDLYISCCD